jgi:cysteine-rich repeat protein
VFGARMRGNLHIAQAGVYTVVGRSNDGYSLRVGGVEVAGYSPVRLPRLDSRRMQFEAAGVYPIELVYWDSGGEAALNVYLASQGICFPNKNLTVLESPCVSNEELSSAADEPLSVAFLAQFQRLGALMVDFPSWVRASSDPAFTVDDESCRLAAANVTCGALASVSCGNGVRERVNVQTLQSPLFSGELCDDGNTRDGDGCSSRCAIEPGYTCSLGNFSACTSEPIDGGGNQMRPDAGEAIVPSEVTRPGQGIYRVACGCQQAETSVGLLVLAAWWLRRRSRGRSGAE